MDPAEKAHEQALRLLEYRARSRRELFLRLRQKGHPVSLIEPLLDRLSEAGLIDDARFAEERGRALALSKGWGPRKIRADLFAKGIAAGLVEEALAAAYADKPQAEILRRVAEKKFGTVLYDESLDPKIKGKAMRFLLGRGFDGELVRDLFS